MVFFTRTSSDDAPTRSSILPGSTTKAWFAVSQ